MDSMTLVDARNDIIDASSLSSYIECPRKWYYTWFAGYRRKAGEPALIAGSLCHLFWGEYTMTKDVGKALEAFYTGESIDMLMALPPDDKRHPDNLTKILQNYVAHWSLSEQPRQTLGVEVPFTITLPNDFLLCGVIDEVYKQSDLTLMMEHKTTSIGPTEWFFKPFGMSAQIMTYHLAVSQTIGHCDGVVVDGTRIDTIREKKDTREWFARRTFCPSKAQQNGFLINTTNLTNEIKALQGAPMEHYRQQYEVCYKYGGCPYLKLCQFEVTHPNIMFNIAETNAVRKHKFQTKIEKESV